MKIDINKIKLTPEKQGFNFCQFGELSTEVSEWASYWNLKTEKSGPYTNILLNPDSDIKSMFNAPKKYQYLDGFSPNLNKHLHVGHLSNLIIANAIQKMGLSYKAIAIFGDTLDGGIQKSDALDAYVKYCSDFGYNVDEFYYASKMEIQHDSLLEDGTGDYIGSKVFNLDGEKIVGIKSTGSSTYFYQDVALAEKLNNTTLYLTGVEQKNHFNSLKKIFPSIDHIGLGLVQLNGKKMSSSEGNIIFLKDFIDQLLPIFDNNIELVYNILAGQILKSNTSTEKSIDTTLITNPKTSLGLYMSYTMAHIKSCGVKTKKNLDYNSKELTFAQLKSQTNLSPNILFEALVKHCKVINKLYETHYIKDNPENIKIFSDLISDLELGMSKLGMFSIEKV